MGGARWVEKVSVEGYLAGERDADVRHEFVDGELFPRQGASRSHCTAVANLARASWAIICAAVPAASASRTPR